MGNYVLSFPEINGSHGALVGGKGAHLAELSRIEGIRVPTGFCVTTAAFRQIMADASSIGDRLDPLSRLRPGGLSRRRPPFLQNSRDHQARPEESTARDGRQT